MLHLRLKLYLISLNFSINKKSIETRASYCQHTQIYFVEERKKEKKSLVKNMEELIEKVPTSVSDYVDGKICLICDIEFQSPIIAIKHAKMNHLDIINTGKVHIF